MFSSAVFQLVNAKLCSMLRILGALGGHTVESWVYKPRTEGYTLLLARYIQALYWYSSEPALLQLYSSECGSCAHALPTRVPATSTACL
jgi:hypothetical protein